MKTFSGLPTAKETLENVDCPVCNGTRFSQLWSVGDAHFVRCRACRLVIQNPRPIATDLVQRYGAGYFQYEIENEENFFSLMKMGLEDVDFFTSIAPTLPQGNSVLDIGCATGRLLKDFRSRGWETTGVEVCTESAEYGNAHYDVGIRNSTLEDAAFESETFNLVHASHLIEHVSDPVAFVNEVARILVPQGVFLCTTPTIDGLQAKLHQSSWRSAIPDHVTLFGKRTLIRLLEKAGFSVEASQTWGGLAVGTSPNWIKKPVDRWAKRFGFGDVLLVVARKNVV